MRTKEEIEYRIEILKDINRHIADGGRPEYVDVKANIVGKIEQLMWVLENKDE